MPVLSTEPLPPYLAALLTTAAGVLNEHVNDHGHCAVCLGERYPCERAQLAEHNLSAL